MGQGMFPLGSITAGAIAANFGPRPAVAIAAVATALAGLFFIRSSHEFRQVRPPKRPAPLPSDSQT
jgi:hypothetical protein